MQRSALHRKFTAISLLSAIDSKIRQRTRMKMFFGEHQPHASMQRTKIRSFWPDLNLKARQPPPRPTARAATPVPEGKVERKSHRHRINGPSWRGYSVQNPASLYIQFVRVDVLIVKLEAIVAAFKTLVAGMRVKKRRVAYQAKLAAEALALNDGEQHGEQAMAEVLAARSEKRKLSCSANGSAPQKKQTKPPRKSHPRFKAPACLACWPPTTKGHSTTYVTPNNPRVVWEVKQIVAHLHDVFGEQEAANKINHLTEPTTALSALNNMKGKWNEGFPPYTSQPVAAMKGALTTRWSAKLPSSMLVTDNACKTIAPSSALC